MAAFYGDVNRQARIVLKLATAQDTGVEWLMRMLSPAFMAMRFR